MCCWLTKEYEVKRLACVELWRWAVYNKAFDLLNDLTNLRTTFEALCGGNVLLHDKYIIAHTQMRVCQLEIEKLRTAISNIGTRTCDFRDISDEEPEIRIGQIDCTSATPTQQRNSI